MGTFPGSPLNLNPNPNLNPPVLPLKIKSKIRIKIKKSPISRFITVLAYFNP